MPAPTTFEDVGLDRIKKHFGARRVLWLDLETYSAADLKKVAAAVYAEHPTTEILMGAYAFDNEPVRQWEGDTPEEVITSFTDKTTLIVAWNMSFEHCIFKYTKNTPISFAQMVDPMVQALYLSFPGKLETVGKILGLSEDKAKDRAGGVLVRRFCAPVKPTKKNPELTRATPDTNPQKWTEFLAYNRRDVEAMRTITYHMSRWLMPIHEWKAWRRDMMMNDRGVPINKKMAASACTLYEQAQRDDLGEMRRSTGIANPNSGAQLLGWLRPRGYPFNDLKKASVQRALTEAPELTPEAEAVLMLRQRASQTSAKKYYRFRDATCRDGTMKFAFQFYGAQRTGRSSGRIAQFQNLKKPSDHIAERMPKVADAIERGNIDLLEILYPNYNVSELLSQAMRGTVQAPEGYMLADADLSAIENIVLGWLAGEEKILNVFREGRDPYLSDATFLYGQTYEDLWHEYKVLKDKTKRTKAKPVTLGCGFGLGAGKRFIDSETGLENATGLIGYAKAMGIELTDEEAVHSVKVWRATYKKVKDFWYLVQDAAIECVRGCGPQRAGPLKFDMSGPFLRMHLPSGRALYYYKPHVRMLTPPWTKKVGNIEVPADPIPNLCYYGVKKHTWGVVNTRGAKMVENATQAVARDLLFNGLRLAHARGIDVRMHIHDQVVALVPKTGAPEVLAELEACMRTAPDWAPDIPLKTGSVLTTHFTKD